MTTMSIPKQPSRELRYFTLTQEDHKKLPWWKKTFGDPDRRLGKRDAKLSPSAWEDSLEGIQREEALRREEIKNALAQNIRAGRDTISRFPGLHEMNRQKQEELRAVDGLLPEAIALTMLKSGNLEMALAIFLLVCEIASLTIVAKLSFGCGLLGPLTLAILITSIIAFSVTKILAYASPEKLRLLRRIMLVTGLLLGAMGLIGFVLLRAVTFTASLMGGAIDLGQLSTGNLLLMAGLTLGVPLVVGVLHHEASEKRRLANNSLSLYRERQLLETREAEWQAVQGKLEEYDGRIDELTSSRVRRRQSNYRAGFHRLAGKNPNAAPFLQALMARR